MASYDGCVTEDDKVAKVSAVGGYGIGSRRPDFSRSLQGTDSNVWNKYFRN